MTQGLFEGTSVSLKQGSSLESPAPFAQRNSPNLKPVTFSQGRFQKESLSHFPNLIAAFDRYLSTAIWESSPQGLRIACPTSFHIHALQKLKPEIEQFLGKEIMGFDVKRMATPPPGPVVHAPSTPSDTQNFTTGPKLSQPQRPEEMRDYHPDFGPRGSPQNSAGWNASARPENVSPQRNIFQAPRGGANFGHNALQPGLPISTFLRGENSQEAERKKRLQAPMFLSSQAYDSVYQLTKRWSQSFNHGARGQALWIHGRPGSGKTTLARQLHEWVDLSKKFVATDIMAFFHEWRRSMEAQDHLSFVRKYRKDADILLLENLDELLGKTKTQIEILYTVNAILDRGGAIVVTSVKHPLELKEMMEPSLFSRIFSGLLLEMPEPDLGFKEKLWRKIVDDASLSDFPIDISVFERLMKIRLDTARKAQSVYINASARISINRRLSMSDVVDLESLHATPGMAVGHQRTPNDLIETVSRLCGVPAAAVLGKVRRANITLTRKFVCLSLARFLGLTNATIAGLLEKDPSTVSHAIRSLEDDLQCDRVIAEQWAWICSQMGMPLAVAAKQV